MIKVIGFDLDNTLYDQSKFEIEVFKFVSRLVEKKYNIRYKDYFDELLKLFKIKETHKVFDKAFIRISKSLPEDWEFFVKNTILPFYRSFLPKSLVTYDGVLSFLYKLKKEEFSLVLITNGNSLVQRNKIKALKLENIFDLILISDDFVPARRKPDLYMFLETLKYFKINPLEMLYIGDDPINDGCSEKLGIRFVNVKNLDFSNLSKFLYFINQLRGLENENLHNSRSRSKS